MAHEIANFLDSIKDTLTDGQYKEGIELCQKMFNETEDKIYRMTYLRPYTFIASHCDDEDCIESKLLIGFKKAVGLVQLSDNKAERIREDNLFYGTDEQMSDFIDINILRSFPDDQEDLDCLLHWFEFPVISLERT